MVALNYSLQVPRGKVIHDSNGISSLNPQPLPPDPPPNPLGNRTLALPPAVMQAPAKSRASGGGTLQ